MKLQWGGWSKAVILSNTGKTSSEPGHPRTQHFRSKELKRIIRKIKIKKYRVSLQLIFIRVARGKSTFDFFLMSSRNTSVERRTYKCKFAASLGIMISCNCIKVALHRALLSSPFCLEKYIFIKVHKEREKVRSADVYNAHDLA